MKSSCERCGRALHAVAETRICSYQCTFCSDCAQAMKHLCPNCGGALVVPTNA